ncbi:protein of unknown function DUF676, lipase-like protein [Cynara cardunculus var. scolymus]|uniref:DUF676 domain-containing protein n=1 Tax=Cynara cardunculus var. scolymus TaxID=59895 RepID=A0A103Y1X5_CYNCS|nr:protein of unknown function DUF676, lipase-like protein [Cynara cardunculus var. scolymus]
MRKYNGLTIWIITNHTYKWHPYTTSALRRTASLYFITVQFESEFAVSTSSTCSSSCCQGFSNCFGINSLWKHHIHRAQAMTITKGNIASSRCANGVKDEPDHLLVLVHGIYASPSDWRYVEAELKRSLGRHFLIYASSSNTYSKTLAGIDGAGKRLADEVKQIVKSTEGLKRISFLAHSLGGLIARHAAGVLYTRNASSTDKSDYRKDSTLNASCNGTIAGLEAINFITLATPHLGVRGNKQLPFLLGVPILEKIAAPIAPIFVGRTGSQLFLTDGKPNKPPLLLRMTTDCEEGNFLSALGAFRYRILYANASYDHLVGRRTSSIRRESELVKPPLESLDGYKHVVDVEICPPVLSAGSKFPPEAARAKEAAQTEMIRGLQQLGWKKVDVSFHTSFWPFFAHNNIHVKDEWFHKAGAGVVSHVADSIKQQEKQHQSASFISANL